MPTPSEQRIIVSYVPPPESVLRDIAAVRDSMHAEIVGLDRALIARIKAIETAVTVAHADAVRIPTLLTQAIEGLRDLVWSKLETLGQKVDGMERTNIEKFTGIQLQFKERDTRVEQQAKGQGEALAAALAAAKELVAAQNTSSNQAISKSEGTTKEQINGLGTLIQSNTKASDEKIDDLKVRLAVIEGARRGSGDMLGWIVGFAGVMIGIVTVIVMVIGKH